MYRVRIGKAVYREVDRLPGHVRQRMRQLIDSLAFSPRPVEAKALRDMPAGYYRIRLERWRLIYRVDDDEQRVSIVAVRRKTGPETYEGFVDE